VTSKPSPLTIRLSLLGGVSLTGGSGGHSDDVVRQPKRLALLAFLAAAAPLRFHRRDSLLAMFWPDLDDTHARAALRRALHFVRRALGERCVVGRGDELGVEPSRLWCDVTAFRDAVQSDRPGAALELYGGTLLEGLFVASAPEFERWLDDERRRLRAMAADAAWQLAQQDDRGGRSADAVRWARRATELAPDDEVGLRKLIGLLDRAGDRAGALQAFDRFAARAQDDLGISPAPETLALAARLRAVREAAPVAATPPDIVPPAPQKNLIAILPFTIRGGPSLAYLREGMVDLLSAKLDGAGDIRTVDPQALLAYVATLGVQTVGPDEGRPTAARFGAAEFLLGSLVEAGGRLQVHCTVFDSAVGTEVRAQGEGEGEAAVFEIVDDIVRQLLARRSTSVGGHLGRLAAVTTTSLPALKMYLAGEREFRLGRYTEAQNAYDGALDLDQGFALAWYRQAAARAASGMLDEARVATGVAWEQRRRLTPHVRALLEAQAAWLAGHIDDAARLYEQVITQRPDDVEAWFHLGHLLFSFNPLRGRSAAEARRPLERTLSLDPRHVAALSQLIRLAALDQRIDDLDTLVERFLALSPAADQALVLRWVQAVATSDHACEERLADTLGAAPPAALEAILAEVTIAGADTDVVARVARRVDDLTGARVLRALPQLVTAHMSVMSGDWAQALHALKQAERNDPNAALEHRGFLLAVPGAKPPHAQVETCRVALVGAPADPGRRASIRRYLSARLSVILGERDRALEAAEQCAQQEPGEQAPMLGANLAAAIRAWEAFDRHDVAAALEQLERITLDRSLHWAGGSPWYGFAAERYLRAAALVASDRSGDAISWIAGLGQRSPFEVVLRRPARALLEDAAR